MNGHSYQINILLKTKDDPSLSFQLAIEHPFSKNSQLRKKRTICSCSNLIDVNNQDDELNCDIKCNGNLNQTCGGYFRNSIYHIINLKFDLLCPKTGEKYQEISCLINVTSDHHYDFNYTLLVDF
ncbi:hypothetical protein BpHYR1_053777, partial [Brachionus plicatilis]